MPLTLAQAEDQAAVLHRFHLAERDRLDRVRQYWKGMQRLPPVIPSSAPREVRQMARIARVNVCDIVVATMAQSLFVEGFRLQPERGQAVDEANLTPWRVWQANKFDRRQTGVHRAALAYGTSYALVLPGQDDPVIRGASPRGLTAMYGEDPDWPVWALERLDDLSWRLYDDEAAYFLSRDREGRFQASDLREHGMGVVPVVRFFDEDDLDADDDVEPAFGFGSEELMLGQVAPLMPLQDQVDITTFLLLVAQWYAGFRQRWIIGWAAESEEQKLKTMASQVWGFADANPEDMKLGEFEQTNLDGYIKSREASLRHAATLSQTPVHELIGELVNLSAEALAAAESGRDRKVDERKTSFGESWEQVFQLVGVITGDDVPDDSQVVWRDTSARSFAATVDALGKLAQMLGIPPQELWERVPGATQQDVERWKATASQGDSLSFLAEMLERQAGNGQVTEGVGA